jgi:hypothetical protein
MSKKEGVVHSRRQITAHLHALRNQKGNSDSLHPSLILIPSSHQIHVCLLRPCYFRCSHPLRFTLYPKICFTSESNICRPSESVFSIP